MANSRSGGSDRDTIQSVEKKGQSKGFFSRRQSVKTDSVAEPNEKGTEATAEGEPTKQELPPVSFGDLFRYVVP